MAARRSQRASQATSRNQSTRTAITDAMRESGVSVSTFYSRRRIGWSVARAASTPPGRQGQPDAKTKPFYEYRGTRMSLYAWSKEGGSTTEPCYSGSPEGFRSMMRLSIRTTAGYPRGRSAGTKDPKRAQKKWHHRARSRRRAQFTHTAILHKEKGFLPYINGVRHADSGPSGSGRPDPLATG